MREMFHIFQGIIRPLFNLWDCQDFRKGTSSINDTNMIVYEKGHPFPQETWILRVEKLNNSQFAMIDSEKLSYG